MHRIKQVKAEDQYERKMRMVKNFILDTNILLSSGKSALYGFDDNNVIITGTTLQELDLKKAVVGETGHNAREVIRELDIFREQGNLSEGVRIGKGQLRIEANGVKEENLPRGFGIERADNRIISACVDLAAKKNESFILVTNDISMRVNADSCFRRMRVDVGIEGYQNDHVKENESYKGYIVDECADPQIIDALYRDGECTLGEYETLNERQFVILKSWTQSAIAVRCGDKLKLVKSERCFGLNKTYNAAQRMSLWALMQPVEEVPLVILKGPAGTGKTLLSLAAGLDGVYGDRYNKVLIGRSNVENRNEQAFGYLPGTLEEKMSPLLAPFTDSLEVLLRSKCGAAESNHQIKMQCEDILTTVVEVCPLVYIRGRSIAGSFLILDEAQNTTARVIKDVISRAGMGTKVVILGDSTQIDASTLDRWSCGLEIAWSKMRGIACEIEFEPEESVRSELAKAAIERM